MAPPRLKLCPATWLAFTPLNSAMTLAACTRSAYGREGAQRCAVWGAVIADVVGPRRHRVEGVAALPRYPYHRGRAEQAG